MAKAIIRPAINWGMETNTSPVNVSNFVERIPKYYLSFVLSNYGMVD